MSTSATFAAIAASQAAIAQSAAHEARVERCKGTLAAFDNKTATVAEVREYASCVNAVYPSPMTGADITGLKVLFVIALAFGIGGSVWEWRNGFMTDWMSIPLFGALWFLIGPILLACVIGLFYGIYWVIFT